MQSNKKKAGFSLLELLVAMATFLVLLIPLFSFMRAGQALRSTSTRLTDVEQSVRAGMIMIGRDVQNAGYNAAPRIDLGTVAFFSPLIGPPAVSPAQNIITPIVPGNNINLVESVSSNGTTVWNATDQITLFYTNQNINNGLPINGTLTPSGSNFSATDPNVDLTEFNVGDLVIVSAGSQFALAVVTNVNLNSKNIIFANSDPYGLNHPGNNGPLWRMPNPVTLYKIAFVTYFVDRSGNLIRREQLPPPHANNGGFTSPTPPNGAQITAATSTYTCAASTTCYHDNIIATGIEDLQFSYYLADPLGTDVTGPISDPGYYGTLTTNNPIPNEGTAPTYRLLDIRQVNISVKARAAERDLKIRDPYNTNRGYLYRFTAEASFNTRNFYGSSYRPS